jgi:hypothetical protein
MDLRRNSRVPAWDAPAFSEHGELFGTRIGYDRGAGWTSAAAPIHAPCYNLFFRDHISY